MTDFQKKRKDFGCLDFFCLILKFLNSDPCLEVHKRGILAKKLGGLTALVRRKG
jgi:hypothetical protein